MANMSYCRMRNTAQDLQDCVDAIVKGEYNDEISRSEQYALQEILELAHYIVSDLTESIEEIINIKAY